MQRRKLPAARTRLCLVPLLALVHAAAFADAGAAGAPALEEALLDVSVNGVPSGEPLLLARGPDGRLYATAAAFGRWRLRLPAAAPVLHGGEAWYPLDAVPGLRAVLNSAAQSLAVEAAPAAFERQTAAIGQAPRGEMTPPGTGAFLNYDLFLEHARGDTNVHGAAEIGLFTPRGVGTTSFVGGAGSGPDRLVRLETSWVIDRPDRMVSLRIGDGVSSVGPGGAPVRFAGIQYARNFAVQPGFVTMPLPALEGSAAMPSVVDVYVNSALQSRQPLGPGPFEVTNVPVQSGGGVVQLVVRDLLGREVVTEQSYYASAQMLRRGLHDFSFEAGVERRRFGVASNDYGGWMASTTHRYGLSDRVTGEAHLQANAKVQMGSVAVTASLFDLALVGGSASVSRSERGTGYRVAASAERRTMGLSFGIRSEYASAGYTFIGMGDGQVPPRLATHAFADMPFRGGAIGVSFVHRDHRDRPDEQIAGIQGSFRVSRSASVHLYARRAVAGEAWTMIGGHLALALGGRRSAAASVEHRRGATAAHLSYQKDPPFGTGGGYRVAASAGPVETLDAVYTHNLRVATLGAHVSHSGGRTGVRLSAAGGVGAVGGALFASRAIGASFAAVKVGDHEGVRVYADNQLVGVTGRDGTAIIPALRPFEANMIRIDEGDLPMDVQLARGEVAVRPFARTGAFIRFDARRERGVLMQVLLEDGSRLPAGARVTIDGGAESWIAVSGGEVYLPAWEGAARMTARWGGQACRFTATVPPGDDPQPRLDGILCRKETNYAAR